MRVFLKFHATSVVVAFCAAVAATCATLAPDQTAPPDLRPALRIGPRQVSNYIFDKYHLRFVRTFTSERNRKPDHAETKDWLEFFLAQQVIMTEAESLGFLERPEVKRTVAQMERHMLMQPAGPLFKKLAAPSSPSDDELKLIFAKTTKVVDGLFARCDNAQAMQDALGDDFESQSIEVQTRRVQGFQNRHDIRIIDGRLVWPYEPFSEIESFLSTAECGRWIRYRDPRYGTYLLFVRTVSAQPSPAFDPDAFRRLLQAMEARLANKRIRLEQLVRAEVAVNAGTSERVLQICLGTPAGISTLPELPDRGFAAAPFFVYGDGTGRIEVAFDAFRQWFNDELIRRIPRSEAELQESVKEYVVQDLLLKRAQAEGLNRDPQFAEDRRGFSDIQALDLYEREVLAPSLPIRAADIEQFYREHAAEFRQVTAVGLRRFAFATHKDAIDWTQGSAAVRQSKTGVVAEYDLEASLDRPADGLESAHQHVFQSPTGTVFGPIPRGKEYWVFVKEKDLATGVLPLSTLAETIRGKLLRQRIEKREIELAGEFARRFEIEDQIDYARFGLSAGEVKAPWHR